MQIRPVSDLRNKFPEVEKCVESGEPVYLDIPKMPHGLIAGQTGSGKSVCINAIIASILFSQPGGSL